MHQAMLRALEERCVSSISPSRVLQGRDEGVAGRNGREKYFPNEGLMQAFFFNTFMVAGVVGHYRFVEF